MSEFEEGKKIITEMVELYLEFRKNSKVTENKHNQKFWRDKMLVDIRTWDEIQGKSKLTEILKYMPVKVERDPLGLRLRFKFQEVYRAEYEDWLWDYLHYLIDICKEPKEGLWDKITGQKKAQ